MRSNLLGMCSVVASVAVAGSASAAIVYNSEPVSLVAGGFTLQIKDSSNVQVASVRFLSGSTATAVQNLFPYDSDLGGSVSGAATFVANSTTGQISNLSTGFLVGDTLASGAWYQTNSNTSWNGTQSSRQLNNSSGGGNFNGLTGYIGFEFFDMAADWSMSNKRYGWIQYQGNLNAGGGTILGYAYEDSGASIAVGAVPAPGALALLGAAGLVGTRRRRN